jgi:DNA-binding XRE family transcriptional regulator
MYKANQDIREYMEDHGVTQYMLAEEVGVSQWTICQRLKAELSQGEKSWVYARGHAHILHNGEVGMAQAVSYAAKRMFESLDKQQENKIYAK